MSNKVVTGALDLCPRKCASSFLVLADSIPQNADIIGSADITNPYETLTSFTFDGLGVISVAIMDMHRKGGEL